MTLMSKAVGAILIAALLVMLGLGLTFWSLEQIAATSETQKHINQIINSADDFLSDLKDAETGQRGYVITGDEAFLQPYLSARDNLDSRLQNLRQLVEIEKAKQHLDAIVPLTKAKLEELAQVIELRRNHNEVAAQNFVKNGRGKQLMDAIQQEMRYFVSIELAAYAERDEHLKSNIRRFLAIMVITSILVILLAIGFAYLVLNYTRQRLRGRKHIN